jgi:hypothetical protein
MPEADDLDLVRLLEVYDGLPEDVVLDSICCILRERVLPTLVRRANFLGFSVSHKKHGSEEFLRFKLNDIGKDLLSFSDVTSTRTPTTGVVADEVLP